MTQLNGNLNGNGSRQTLLPGLGNSPQDSIPQKNGKSRVSEFDQPVILRRSPLFSRAALWSILGVTVFTVTWAYFSRIDQAVPAQGKLEPQGTVREVQVPVNGMVKEVFVKDGDRVKQGDLLLRLDHAAAEAELVSTRKVREALKLENQFYRSLFSVSGSLPTTASIQVPQEMANLAQSRAALLKENQFYRVLLSGNSNGVNLTGEQQLRLFSSQEELRSQGAQIKLEQAQLQQQLAQTKEKLDNSRNILSINQGILNDLEPLYKEGAIARLQYLQQKQEVSNRQSEVAQLSQEIQRLRLAITQTGQQLQNALSTSTKDILTQIADNEKRIAEIDSQINKSIVENEKRIAELDGQIKQALLTRDYQVVKAPVDGVIFDMKASNPGYVANTTEPVLKVVPEQSLKAEVFITNKDIGFVKEGMPVDVRFESYNFSEFGDIKGTLVSIGKDALPPDQIYPYYRFPAKVELDRQTLAANGRQLPLQSGMSVTANIKTRDRSILSIFTDKFTQTAESVKFVR
ncbi:HlyD family efflux transporter periplasmic adaptor subunit [Plectonema cf. radiosum LEGE 06105]|uniref:HlyD family efflux transporter periplasmic adaptor subunit n=1 Tax=Plectonema cf. radiosum LEGE 06105 TaxID=945769 RepID=A0A8J7F6F7_9CYAN|nr:HlyD family efflux transporter periplasmic adaptor subunit [Plectonema radiosum]MBE9212784.1 HlyD family efflux transporter periplasmic adaptor subunit [Plectonema cf. radiosum LEGE 06105]